MTNPKPKLGRMADRLCFWCPGCKTNHGVWENRWTFNGDFVSPSLTPSVVTIPNRECPELHLCHLFVTEGKLVFLSDCSHDFAGQTVPMEDWE